MCYFDPYKPFERRLFNESWQKETLQKKNDFTKKDQNGNIMQALGRDGQSNSDIQKHSLKRVMKTIDNFILSEYQLLFQNQSQQNSAHSKEFFVKQSDLYNNEKLLRKAKEELQFCED